MATVAEVREEIVPVGNGRVDMRVQVRGSGPPLVFLHPAAGFAWDPFLEQLATERDGLRAARPRDVPRGPRRDRRGPRPLGARPPRAGGARRARTARRRSRRQLVRRDARLRAAGDVPRHVRQARRARPDRALARRHARSRTGSWPPSQDLPAMLFADPSSPGAQAMFTLPEDHAQMADAIAAMTWAMGCTAKFVWPVPDRGLDRRLHRITAPTLVIWGKQDALVPACTPRSSAAGSRARASRCSRAAATSRRWRSRRRRSRSSGGS